MVRLGWVAALTAMILWLAHTSLVRITSGFGVNDPPPCNATTGGCYNSTMKQGASQEGENEMTKMTATERKERLASLKTIADAYAAGVTEEELFASAPTLIGRYSFRNVCLILGQRPDATECAGFHDWKKVGRSVSKGAKGIAILVPIIKKSADEGDKDSMWFTYRYVFDLSDTEEIKVEVAA